MTNGRAKTVRFATSARLAKVNPKSIKIYEQYLKTSIVKNQDVKETTYKVYKSYFNIFLCFVMERWDNFDLLDEEFLDENMIDVMEDYIVFLQEELGNGKKTINTKLSAVSSFYMWAAKRRKIKAHPFDGKLDRMKNPNEEKIIAEYFLNKEQVEDIVAELSLVDEPGGDYDKMDQLLWHIPFDSACRIGAIAGLMVSNLSLEKRCFVNVREKRGKKVNIPFTNATAILIQEWLDLRAEMGVDCDDFFAIYRNGEWSGMSKQSISARIKKLGHIIGLGDFRPHCIRKTRLNMVAKLDINKAKALANHDSLDTTSKFYTEKEDQTDTLESIMELEKQDQTKDKG